MSWFLTALQLWTPLRSALSFIQEYFAGKEHRDPTITEIRVLDTYWSDHCRHTTFSTELKNIEFEDGYYRTPIETTFQSYTDTRQELYAGRTDKPVCLMDLALMGMKKLKADGKLTDMEESEENNTTATVPGQRNGWSSLKTRPTTTRQRSNPSAAQPPAWEARSATRSPDAAMSIRPCA